MKTAHHLTVMVDSPIVVARLSGVVIATFILVSSEEESVVVGPPYPLVQYPNLLLMLAAYPLQHRQPLAV